MNPNFFPVHHAPRTRSLFVGDLSFFCTEIDLAEIFSPFGKVINIEIKRSRGGDSLMHGFVDFHREADAAAAIQFMNGRKFMGRRLKVNWTNQKSNDAERESWVQVHVNFLSPVPGAQITETLLESIFMRFGRIADISVKRHLHSIQPNQVTGYAYVYFYDAHTALRSIYGLRGGPSNGVFLECCLSHKATQVLKDVQGMNAVIRRQQTANPSAFFKRFEQQSQSPISEHRNRITVDEMAYRPRYPLFSSNSFEVAEMGTMLPSSSSSTGSSIDSTPDSIFNFEQPLFLNQNSTSSFDGAAEHGTHRINFPLRMIDEFCA